MSKKLEKQDRKISECIEYFKLCNQAEGKSPKTIEWYTENLNLFYRYLRSRHLPDSLESINIKLLREYILYLQNKRFISKKFSSKKIPLSSVTVHCHVRTLKVFTNWMVREELIDYNPAKNLKPPKIVKKVIDILTDEEIYKIFKSFRSGFPTDYRNETIFALLLDTGLRIGELVNLQTSNAHVTEGYLKVIGKGNKERIVPIGVNAQKILHRYLFRFRPRDNKRNLVFLSVSGEPLTGNSMKLMFSRLAKLSGVLRLHAHLCRHTFATRFLINGGDVFTLQQILGHSSLEMVRNYVSLASSHVTLQHRKFSPLDYLQIKY